MIENRRTVEVPNRTNSEGMAHSTDERSDADSLPSVTVHEGVTYAEREAGEMKLDLYVPEIETLPPLVVYVHGGGWIFETRANCPDLERYAAEWGYAIASVSYRLAPVPDDVETDFQPDPSNPTPKGVFPDQLCDVKAAIRWLRANAERYGFDAERVATWGASAGGHLAALAGTVEDVTDLAGEAYPEEDLTKTVAPEQSGAVDAVVDWYGISDLLELPAGPDSPESLLLGGPVADRQARARAASPRTHVTAESPPFLLVHGRADETVPVEQSRLLYDALTDAGVEATLYELRDLGHVFGADSERTAMERLTAEPRPAQSITASVHLDEGATESVALDGKAPAGAASIAQFLDRTIG